MATGRGWILKQHSLGASQRLESSSSKESAAMAAQLARIKKIRGQCNKPATVSSSAVNFDRMPSEVVMKIFSYLDTESLLCVGCVNKRFYQLSSDNTIWFKIYSKSFQPKRKKWQTKSVQEPVVDPVASERLPEFLNREEGYWKKEYIEKKISADRADIIQLLKPINTYTGLPLKTKEAIRNSGLRWVIVLKDTNGKEYVMDQEDISFNEISVTLSWYKIGWPCLETLSTLQLCGMTPVFLGNAKVHLKMGPWRRSLICEYELDNLTEKAEMIGCDGLVDLYRFDQGLLVGLWKESGIAFVMASLHYNQLIERSILGSASMRYVEAPDMAILDDIDPEYGMHGYQLHIELQSRGKTYMCNTFRSLFCKKGFIKNGYLRITVISYKNHAQHLPLVGDVGLSWRTDAFEGNIQNCFIMDATILDDSQKPFWCVSAPVNMILSAKRSILYEYLGPKYYVNHVDCTGKIHMALVWMSETNEYHIVNLVLYLRTQKVNSWFGTNY
ncbi:F-box only protein 15 isoform X2 [Sceloporus undulatus]|uniref:F-box only protein 15 isoform X2 n=1 Tax=Sceloporus undulatus TaxID=8520 RepID=UPI001C4BD3AB|nr:F-box only protein 15 isoform X2 [Sceloporus undulatus]